MATPAEAAARAIDLRITDDELTVLLTDGLRISAPLVWSARLLSATKALRDLLEKGGIVMRIAKAWRLLVIPHLLAATACTTMAPSRLTQRPFTPVGAVAARVALPPLNSEAVAQVGDTMIEGGTVYRRDAIRLLNPITHRGVSKASYTIHIPAGTLVASGTFSRGTFHGTFFEAQQPLPFQSMGNFTVRGGVFLPESEGSTPEIYWHATDTGVPLVDAEPSIRFERTTHEVWQGDSFRRELVYNGRSGETIKLLYREFSEERIRPAFTQEVTYDLAQGETIGFKGARFQVLDADNIRIKYVVLHHFD